MISPSTRSAWLLGSPVAHSLSPRLHQAAYRSLGADLVYLCARVEPADLPAALDGLERLGAVGCNLTHPLKRAAAGLCTRLEGAAAALQVVNTIHLCAGERIGYNTDGAGWLASWDEEIGAPLAGRRVVVLGAGGAARAVCLAVAGRGVGEIVVLHRRPEAARALAEALGRPGLATRGAGLELEPWLEEGAVVVQATPVGMEPSPDHTPARWPSAAPAGVVAAELVYAPRETRFLREAVQAGARPLGGAGMLAHQAAGAVEIWLGEAPSVEAMRRALDRP